MANFGDPQIPSVPTPDWTNVTRPVSQPEADKSTGIALQTAGTAIDEGATIADRAEKQDLKDQVDTGVNKLRDAYTSSLVAVRNMQIGGQAPSLLPNQPNVPTNLQNGLDKIQQIGDAQNQGGNKVNDTLYTGALNAMAKQLRAQYPGYRDYIDEQIKSVSGVDPANAFMKNLLTDINNYNSKKDTQANATMTMLRKNLDEGMVGLDGVPASRVMDLYKSGQWDESKVNDWVNRNKSLDYRFKQLQNQRTIVQGQEADDKVLATKQLSQKAGEVANNSWTTMSVAKGTDSPQGMASFLQAHSGQNDVNDETAMAIGQQFVAMRQATFNTLMQKANEGGAKSLVNRLGGDPTEAAKVINGQLAMFDLAISDIHNKDWGSAYSHMNMNKAITADTTNHMYNAPDEDVRKYNRMVGAINDISPQFGKDFFTSAVIGDVPEKEKEFIKNSKMEMITQPDQPAGKLTSLNSAIHDAKSSGITSPKSYRELVNQVQDINNPKLADQHRYNLAQTYFNPDNNAGVLSDDNFKMDHYDPVLKRNIPGKYSVFTTLSSDNVGQGVKNLAATHPDVIPMYRTTMEREFGEQLWGSELLHLSQSNDTDASTRNYKIAYTNVPGRTPRFDVVHPDGSPMTMTEAQVLRAPIQTVNRMNEGITGLYSVYKNTGSQDPAGDVFTTMSKYGYQSAKPTNAGSPGWNGGVSDLPRVFWNSLVASQQESLRRVNERRSKESDQ